MEQKFEVVLPEVVIMQAMTISQQSMLPLPRTRLQHKLRTYASNWYEEVMDLDKDIATSLMRKVTEVTQRHLIVQDSRNQLQPIVIDSSDDE